MKNNLSPFILSSLLLTGAIQANEETSSTELNLSSSEPSVSDYFKISLDARLRYESRIEQSFDHSDALTLRLRPGLSILHGKTLSAFIESEHTTVIVDDFRAGNSALNPFRANNTQIIDAESNEVNQAYIQLQHEGFTARVGRQTIKLDNLLFVGNAGWRQNEQSFEAASLNYKNDKTFLYYAYANQINRVFGSEATGNQRLLEGDMHIINATTHLGETKVGGYAYLLEFDPVASFANSNSYGIQVDHHGLHAEYAIQTESGNRDSYTASYVHLHYTKEVGNITYKAGIEYLEDEFVSPIAALHGANGSADVFISARRGLADWDGLTDIYGTATTKIGDVNIQAGVHYFGDDTVSDAYGWEIDIQLSKKLTDNLNVVALSAYFHGDDDNTFNQDVIQNSIQLDYKF